MTDEKGAIQMTEQACQVPENTLDNFKDFLGRYTIVLNGTVIEKRLDQPEELSFENKREVFERFERLVLADRRRVLEEYEGMLCNVCQLLDGWHQDGTAWTEWDESVRKDVSEKLAKLAELKELA